MPTERVVLDSDLRYIDSIGNLLRSRSEFSVAKMLTFLGHAYRYNVIVKMPSGKSINLDFEVEGQKYIEVIDSEADANKFKQVREELPNLNIIAIGNSKYASKLNEIDSLFFFGSEDQMQ